MAAARYVLLGLAPARAAWFREVGQWANASSIPAEFLKCVSPEEVRSRLSGGRVFSALLVDGTTPGLDRDLIDRAADVACAVIVVGGSRGGRDWLSIGAAGQLPDDFDRKDLLDALGACAVMIGRADRLADPRAADAQPGWQAPLIAVTGPGGTGASTAAIAVAQGLATDVRDTGAVLLADFCLQADLAVLHDVGDVIPGVQELVDGFRAGQPGANEIHSQTFAIAERGYQLLLGIRRRSAWSTIRPRAFEAALHALRLVHRVVVADVDADLEGEDEGGSADVEERHLMARTVCAGADAVFVVGTPGMKGLHALARVIAEVLAFGVPSARVVPVINRAPRAARQRSEITLAHTGLLPPWAGASMPTPIFLPERRVDEALRDGVRLPDSLSAPLVGAYRAVVARAGADVVRPNPPQLVRPGSLGAWDPLAG